jgi:aromatic ring-opening dioxygenase catalytic subunit (LigB family)
LRDEGVLIIGSGLSFHNLRLFGPGAKVPSEAFDAWLAETMAAAPADRTDRLLHWESAPCARICHKEEDHFAPIFAALGAAEGEAATMVYHDTGLFGGVTASSYRIG